MDRPTIVSVAVDQSVYQTDKPYSYLVPPVFASKARPGCRVLVPFGNGNVRKTGVILGFSDLDDTKRLKAVISVLDDEPILTEDMLKLAGFIREQTFCTWYNAVRVLLPPGINYKVKQEYEPGENAESFAENLDGELKILADYMLQLKKAVSKETAYQALGFKEDCGLMEKLVSKGVAVRTGTAVRNVQDASLKMVRLTEAAKDLSSVKLTPKQKQLLAVLEDLGCCSVKELCYFTGLTQVVISGLCKKGIAEIFEQEYYRNPYSNAEMKSEKPKELTEQQKKAFDQLMADYKSAQGVTSLLYGVTGSGKTQVFLKMCDEVVNEGRGVIVMVPEIALTPQMMSIFKGRYGDDVAIFHSGLSAGERRDEYRRVFDKKASIAVGTRSAVFAPFDNLGLIVIDEEQEHTYKSESSPKYHARDVAKFRAAKHKALLLLASATPSLSSFSNAQNGKYDIQVLDERYGEAVLPEVTVVDMKQERKSGNKYNISSPLLEMLEKNLNEKKQSILLINRRGFNTFAACDECGQVLTCPSCSISLTYHSANNRLMCHYCGYSTVFTKVCPECKKDAVRYAGYGTQRIEKELEELLPEAKVVRLDTDSTSTKHSFEKALSAFGNGEYDIMLGTQMVAKGLNFENVTLVGVINADQQLNNDDFRSGERTFDLLTQVIGRSGRGKFKGNAVIQTLTPENNVIRLAEKQDYNGFYNSEIIIRRVMVYPPFCDICAVSFVSKNEVNALNTSKDFLSLLKKKTSDEYNNEKIIVLGPMPPRISKINNKFIYRIIIKCKNSKRFRAMISEMLIYFGKDKRYSDVYVGVDINPESLV